MIYNYFQKNTYTINRRAFMMNRLKIDIIFGIIFVIITGTLSHFIYEWTNHNFITGFFTPVNESTWEHMKLVFFPMLIYSAFLEHKLSKEYPCIVSSLCFGILSGTWLVAILFYSYSGILGYHVFVLDLMVFIVSVLAAFFFVYRLTLRCSVRKLKTLLLILTGIMLACFLVFSCYPPKLGVFAEPDTDTQAAAAPLQSSG
jgi:hypothetical protein